jgi:TonB-dependent receptor
MKHGFFAALLFLFLLIIAGQGTTFAQSTGKATVTGRITTSDTKEELPFANIIVLETTNGTTTDMNGEYILKNVPTGKQKLKITYIGYEDEIKEVNIKPGEVLKLNVVLKPHTIQTKEVIITAQAKGQIDAINQQVSSNTIKNVVSAERLKENPDANAAEALGRLPGLSLVRSGGEGTGIIIRGMQANYSNVTLNGVELPSTDAISRGTGISGISQFLLQTVEVIKAKTPDMDGNSVAGSINLKLAEAPDSLSFNLLAQGGYNHMNDYWGNYKVAGTISNRFFNKALGVRLDVNFERVNRSTQTMSAGYSIQSNTSQGQQYDQVYLGSVYLNDIKNIPSKQSATLVLDFPISKRSKIVMYNFISHSSAEVTNVSKYTALDRPYYHSSANQYDNSNIMYTSSIKAEHDFHWAEIEYGAAYSQTHTYTPQNRNWNFLWRGGDYQLATNQIKMLTPQQVLRLYHDNSSDTVLNNMILQDMGYSSDDMRQRNYTSFLDIKVPVVLGDMISGYVKGGAKFTYTDRTRTYLSATQTPPSFSEFGNSADAALDWVHLNSGQMVNAIGVVDHNIGGFLNDQFTFGWYPRMDRLNQIWDWWNNLSNSYFAQGSRTLITDRFGDVANCGFRPDILGSSLNNQSLEERYYGTYLMTELNISSFITTMAGARYEKVTNYLNGKSVNANASTYGISIPGESLSSRHNDEFLLPMIHLQVKPNEWLKIHASYTQALSRPNFNALIPNKFYSHVYPPFSYVAGNPDLKPELWSNYDLQAVVFGNEVGLFSINAFYKTVQDKIWQRSFKRLPGDPVVPGFAPDETVNVTVYENHKDKGYVKGLEFEWQTNFWYLPSVLKYFTLNLNYTILKSEQQYPVSTSWTSYDMVNGRPVAVAHRVDATIADQMTYQPDNIANISLGFNYEGLNIWLSYQYNGKTLTSWSNQKELIPYKDNFQRWDLQATQKLPVKGLVVLFNIANISNYTETSRMMGDPRPTYLESYGWTSDLGVKYEF